MCCSVLHVLVQTHAFEKCCCRHQMSQQRPSCRPELTKHWCWVLRTCLSMGRAQQWTLNAVVRDPLILVLDKAPPWTAKKCWRGRRASPTAEADSGFSFLGLKQFFAYHSLNVQWGTESSGLKRYWALISRTLFLNFFGECRSFCTNQCNSICNILIFQN